MKAQKEQLAQLGKKVSASRAEQDTAEAQLLQKERSAAKQVGTGIHLTVRSALPIHRCVFRPITALYDNNLLQTDTMSTP